MLLVPSFIIFTHSFVLLSRSLADEPLALIARSELDCAAPLAGSTSEKRKAQTESESQAHPERARAR